MIDLRHCRIVITDKCNLHCDYCIMKDKDISQSFKTTRLFDILANKYDIYLLTGGEPTCDEYKLLNTIYTINETQPKAEVYIYTNGLAPLSLYKDLAKFPVVKGLNIGWHGMEMFEHYDAINSIIPIRIYALYYEVTRQLEIFCRARGIELRVLKWNQCDNENEPRYCLE